MDASNNNVPLRFPGRLNGDAGPFDPWSSSHLRLRKNLGNPYLFRWNGGSNKPNDAEACRRIARRYSGVLNVSSADPSSKAVKDAPRLNDLRDRAAQSMWDPYR